MTPRADDLTCLVVSLTRSTDRREAIGRVLDSMKIDFRFVDAIDASRGFDARTERSILRSRATLSEGEFACALSHQAAYDAFLAGDRSHALILEDDALPTDDLERFCREALYRSFPMQLLFHSRARVFKSRGTELPGGVTAYPLAMSCTGAVAYTVDRTAADELRRANTPVRFQADWPMDISSLGARVLQPAIVEHPPRTGDQSLLAIDRQGVAKAFHPTRWLSKGYLRRKWLKTISTRIS